jgi:hypothetical protein
MSKILRHSLFIGIASVFAAAVAAAAGNPVHRAPGLPYRGPPFQVTTCPAGFTQTASWGDPNGIHYFACTANVVCPNGASPINAEQIGLNATRTGQMAGALQYTCNYTINQ